MSQKYDFFLSDGLNKDWSDYGSELHLAQPSAQNHPHDGELHCANCIHH